jgi:hypothetical protein
MDDKPQIYYRLEDRLVSKGIDEFENDLGAEVRVYLKEYPVLSYTQKGVWLKTGFSDKRFVLLNAKKQFAHSTKEEALASFLLRKDRQESIYLRKAKFAREAALKAKFMFDNIPITFDKMCNEFLPLFGVEK